MTKHHLYSILSAILLVIGLALLSARPIAAQTVTDVEEEVVVADPSLEEDAVAAIDTVEFIPQLTDEFIQDRLLSIQKDIKLTFNKTTRSFIDYFTIRNRRYPMVMERRKNLYFPIFEAYLKKYNMPEELKYLAIVESGLNPRATSRVGAAGLWQFMPVTGKEYRLYQDEYIDERLDPYKATDAACRYLKEAYRVLGDWELAIASYNCGIGNVRRAIRKSRYHDSFWEVYKHLPQETRSYVPQFIALTYVMNHLKDHNIVADSIEYPMEHDTIMVNRQYMNLDVLCSQLNICPEDFLKLNPAIKKNIIPARTSYVVHIPTDKISALSANRFAIMDSCSRKCLALDTASAIRESLQVALEAMRVLEKPREVKNHKTIYVVRKGDGLGKISAKYHVSVSDIKKWNKIRNNTVKVGQRLAIYKESRTPSASRVGKQAVAKRTQAVRTKKTHYLVQPGDTLWTISKKCDGISVDRLKKLNKLKGNDIKPGQKLVLG